MKFATTEYDHFVSFACDDFGGRQVLVQYRRDQVWQDEDGVWHVGDRERPFWAHVSPAASSGVKLSPAILEALSEAAKAA